MLFPAYLFVYQSGGSPEGAETAENHSERSVTGVGTEAERTAKGGVAGTNGVIPAGGKPAAV